MYNDSQKLALSEEFKANLLGDSDMRKTAGLAASEYFRTEIRENAIYRQIIPTTTVTADNFDTLEDSDFPAMIVEIAPKSSGAYKVSFETNPKNGVVAGQKARIEFNRIMTRKYELDKIRLTGYKMDLLEALYDLILKDIMDVEDESWTAVNQDIVGWSDTTATLVSNQTQRVTDYGCRRAIVRNTFTRADIAKIKQGIINAPGNLKPAKQLMTELFYSDFYQLDRTAVGGDMAQDILINGFTQTKVNGVDTLVTSKDSVCSRNDVWCFTDPKYYAGFYTYKDVAMVIDEKDDIWLTFFAHETIGGGVVNKAGVCVTRFDTSASASTDWK